MDESKLFRGLEEPPENKQEKEKELSLEEIDELSQEMSEYLKGLRERIKEIENELERAEIEEITDALNIELADLKEQLEGLDLEGWIEDIEEENYESIIERTLDEEE